MPQTLLTPYQVDFSTKNASKTFGFSKKRVSFKFGVASNEALAQGLTGANCRGSEHEVIFIWSLNSGKRQILADGKDVHFSESGQNGWTNDQVFQHHFNLRVPNFSTPVRCHLITQPANRDVPSIKPFDLRVNGISFFSFSKIFQLGTSQMVSRPLKATSSSRGGQHQQRGGGGPPMSSGGDDDQYCTPDERKAIAAAKLASIRDLRGHEAGQMGPGPGGSVGATSLNRDEGNLINLLEDPMPAPAIPAPTSLRGHNNFVSSVTLDPTLMGNMGGQHPPQQQFPPSPAYAQQPYSNYASNPPTQQPPQPDPSAYGQPPPAYGQPLQQQPPAYGEPPPAYGQPPQQQPPAYGQPPSAAAAAYGQPPPPEHYGQPPAYGQPPQQAYYQAPPPQQYQQQQQQQHPGFGSPSAGYDMRSPSSQTALSYGSAPSFAQPPRQQPGQGFPRY
jgi:hypothetical protein